MTNLLQRLADFFRGRANRVLDELEDPREQFGLFVNDLSTQLADLRGAVARAMKDEKRLRLEIRDHLSKAADWERRAVFALEDGDETLARQSSLFEYYYDFYCTGFRFNVDYCMSFLASLFSPFQLVLYVMSLTMYFRSYRLFMARNNVVPPRWIRNRILFPFLILAVALRKSLRSAIGCRSISKMIPLGRNPASFPGLPGSMEVTTTPSVPSGPRLSVICGVTSLRLVQAFCPVWGKQTAASPSAH